MSSIAIFGVGGHAKVIADMAEQANHKIIGFFDDNPAAPRKVFSYAVLGGFQELVNLHKSMPELHVVIAVGKNTDRKKLAEKFAQNDLKFATIIHPSAIISKYSQIGEGTVIMPGAIVNCSTEIGTHAILNTGCTVDHDCKISNFAHVAPGVSLCGNVKVGEGTLVGVGAKIAPNTTVGSWNIVGAGSTVISEIADNLTVVGSPAREIKKG